MNVKKFILILFIILILPIFIYADKLPGLECLQGSNRGHIFQGTVIWANGTAIPGNNSVNATLGDYHFTTTTDSNGQYGSSSRFEVWNCVGDIDNTITFYVQGVATNTTTFSEGAGPTTFNITAVGAVCGDGSCNGSETTGNTNVFPECNRDCGAPSTTTTTGGGGGGTSGGTGGGGAAVPSQINLDIKATFTTVGYTARQTQGDTATFTLKGKQYTAELTKLMSDSITITVAGQSRVLKIGETAEFDVDGDGVNDISVTLAGIEGGRAEVVYKLLAKAAEPSEEVPEAEVEEEITPSEVVPPEEKIPIMGWIIVGVIVIIGLLVYFVFARKKK